MPVEFIDYVTKYGYWAIFLLVFLQEVGVPNPVPNELLLISSGYLISIRLLKFPLVILSAITADCMATLILHTVFYFSGAYILQRKPRWLPLSTGVILKLKKRISRSGLSAIYLGRLTPFIRGYTSVLAGLLQVKSLTYLPIALVTASVWATSLVLTGILLGPFWERVSNKLGNLVHIWLLVPVLIMVSFVFFLVTKIVTGERRK